MSTRTTFEGMLRTDDENLASRMNKWLSQGDPSKRGNPPSVPARVVVRHSLNGAGGEMVAEVILDAIPATADGIVEDLERQIREKLGSEPEGAFRFRGWGDGCSGAPGLDFSRICQRESWGTLGGDVGMLKWMLERALADNAKKDQIIVSLSTQQGAVMVSQSQAMGVLATTRAIGSTAADNSNPWAFLGFALVTGILPMLAELAESQPDSPFSQVVQAANAVVRRFLPKSKKEPDKPKQLESASKPVGTPKEAPKALETQEHIEPQDLTPEQLIGLLQSNEEFRKALIEGIVSDEALRDQLGRDMGVSPALMRFFQPTKKAA